MLNRTACNHNTLAPWRSQFDRVRDIDSQFKSEEVDHNPNPDQVLLHNANSSEQILLKSSYGGSYGFIKRSFDADGELNSVQAVNYRSGPAIAPGIAMGMHGPGTLQAVEITRQNSGQWAGSETKNAGPGEDLLTAELAPEQSENYLASVNRTFDQAWLLTPNTPSR